MQLVRAKVSSQCEQLGMDPNMIQQMFEQVEMEKQKT
jgi:hypothetical protein